MKRLLIPLLLALLASTTAHAEVHRARYGVAETFNFKLYNADGTLDVDEADGGTEVSLSCDEGAETTATNDFVDEGTFYSIALTAAELKCERVAVVVAATTTEVFFIQTSALDNGVIAFGTAQSATATTIVLAAATSFADDILNCSAIAITGGTGAGQTKTITDWVSATDTATVSTWVTNPDNTSVYEVYHVPCSTFADNSITAAAMAADAGTELGTAVWATTTRALTILDEDSTTIDLNASYVGGVTVLDEDLTTIDLNATPTGAAASVAGNVSGSVASVVNLEQVALADAAVLNCTVNTANFAGSSTTVACILTERDGGAVTIASNDLEGRELLVLSGTQIYEGRYIIDSTWDGANSEAQFTLSRALPGTLADAVTAIVR